MNETYTAEELQNLPFMNSNLDLEKRVEDLLNRLTLEEKFKISAGRMMWHTKPIKRFNCASRKPATIFGLDFKYIIAIKVRTMRETTEERKIPTKLDRYTKPVTNVRSISKGERIIIKKLAGNMNNPNFPYFGLKSISKF